MDREIAYLVIAAAYAVFLVMFFGAIYDWNWRKAICHTFHGNCDWRWRFNEPRWPSAAPEDMNRHTWIGRYRCSRCLTWSDGCARWEQRNRELHAADGS